MADTPPDVGLPGADDDPGTNGLAIPISSAPLAPAPPARPAQMPKTQISAGDEDSVERIPAGLALGAERRGQLRAILSSIHDGGVPFGRLVLPVPTDDAGTRPRGKAGKAGKAGSMGKAAGKAGAAVSVDADSPDDRRWPSGPLIGQELFAADEVQRIIEAILTDPEIMAHPSMPGLTRARLREAGRRAGFEPNRFGRFSAALLIWFAQAGVTALVDDKATTEWARPRPLIGNSRAEIRRRLRAVDPPDAASAAAIARSAGFHSSSL